MTESEIRKAERERCARIARMAAEKAPIPMHGGALLVERAILEEHSDADT